MEEGSLRCDANVSIRPAGSEELGTKTELKNMNSFRFIERGIDAELERQRAIVAAGEQVTQETLHFDPRSGSITSLRSKEEAHDYRYFPEPDLVPLAPTEEMLAEARAALPELPAEREERYASELGLPDAPRAPARARPRAGELLRGRRSAAEGGRARRRRELGDRRGAALREVETPTAGAWRDRQLVAMVEDGKVTNQAAQEGPREARRRAGETPPRSSSARALAAMEDSGELEAIVDRGARGPSRRGREGEGRRMQAIGPIIGFVMRETKGAADGREVTS